MNANSLSAISRQLTRAEAVLFGLMGLVLFFVPGWSADNFLWKVSPFVAMTMGGWYLGSAVVAWEAARVWSWPVVYARVVYLWAFGFLESLVVLLHTDKLRPNMALGWPYLLMLGVACVAALVQIFEWVRLRPGLDDGGEEGPAVPGFLRVLIVVFTGFVFFLAVMGGLGFGQGAQVFPEKLSLFTIHGFAAFYLALGIGALTLLWARSIKPVIAYSQTGEALIVPITLAALVNLDKFDFAGRPGGMVYIGIYLVVGAAVVVLLWSYRGRAGLHYASEV